jgi:uncharacterized protein YndB with AHSA1/START domain
MAARSEYVPGPASGAQVQKDGDKWTLILVREMRHPPELVWEALTDPAHLAEWAPFDADRNLAAVGPVKMWMVRAPQSQVFETAVTRAEAPRLLEYSWGAQQLRWELEPLGEGTRMTLWHAIDRRFVAWGAAGWHISFDVLDRLLAGEPIGRMAGDTMRDHGWARLVAEYAKQFGAESPNLPPRTGQTSKGDSQ